MNRRPRITDLTALAVPEQPALSPDGRTIAYVLRTADVEADRTVRAIWAVGARTGGPRRLTRGPGDASPAWSPDGRRLAFLRDGEGGAQIWLLPADGGEAEQVTTLPLGAGAPVWSPDGSRIAFAAPVDLRGPGAPEGVPTVVERLGYQADGLGLVRTLRIHLHVLDPATGQCRQVTEGDWNAGDPAWSPDSARLAFAAATGRDADLTGLAPLHVVDVCGPWSAPVVAGLADGKAGRVAWSPDGASLLTIGTRGKAIGLDRLFLVPLAGGEPVDLAASLDRSVLTGLPFGCIPRFTADGRSVLFCIRDRGDVHLYEVGLTGGVPRALVTGTARGLAGLSVAGGLAVTVLRTASSVGEIATFDLATGEEVVRTAHGDPELDLWVRSERTFTTSDGTAVHGWLLRDPEATGPQPLLLDIHGGPHGAWGGAAAEWYFYQQALATRGWTVLILNPRGSDGYGEAFMTAVVGAWGESDANDVLEPIDTLVAEGLADPERLAVTGYSYGGYLTCWLTGHDDRFAAAIGGGVVTDLAGMAGTSDIGRLLSEHEYGGRPWEVPERFVAQSPLTSVGNVRTPTLLLQGEEDLRCPPGQAQQWHAALRALGVPSRLVLYPGASHSFVGSGKPSHQLDYCRQTVDWLERYVTGTGRPGLDAEHWQRRLAVLAERHGVPGATLGILRLGEPQDQRIEVAYGVLNKDTGVEVTTDSVFQVGSVTKVWTATLALQLADEGLLDLDAPVAEVLPELQLADDEVAKRVTMRHLLTHTSGIDGDIFTDTGRGDDCLERYVSGLRDVPQAQPLGATWSYSNAGFVLAGRVIERITGTTWDEALRRRLIEPLALTRTVTLPEEALLLRAAVGHLRSGRTPVWGLPRSLGPAGLISSSVADILAFARLHLTGGLTPGGRRLLSARAAAEMAAEQADIPDKHTLGDSWGLGWTRLGWNGHRLIGHDGNTIGQSAFLRLLPEQDLAVVLLTNGGNTKDLYEELFAEIFAEVAGITMTPALAPPADPPRIGARAFVGRYEREGMMMEVAELQSGPVLRVNVTGPLAAVTPEPSKEYPLIPVTGNLFVFRDEGERTWSPVTFYTLPTGEQYVHTGVRATRKVA